MSDVPHDRKMCLKRTFSFLFCAVIQNHSSDGSLQLVALGMGKSPCEHFIIFTCNIHTHDSSHSTYINSRYKAFYWPIKKVRDEEMGPGLCEVKSTKVLIQFQPIQRISHRKK
jgi:hypothetical protein